MAVNWMLVGRRGEKMLDSHEGAFKEVDTCSRQFRYYSSVKRDTYSRQESIFMCLT